MLTEQQYNGGKAAQVSSTPRTMAMVFVAMLTNRRLWVVGGIAAAFGLLACITPKRKPHLQWLYKLDAASSGSLERRDTVPFAAYYPDTVTGAETGEDSCVFWRNGSLFIRLVRDRELESRLVVLELIRSGIGPIQARRFLIRLTAEDRMAIPLQEREAWVQDRWDAYMSLLRELKGDI